MLYTNSTIIPELLIKCKFFNHQSYGIVTLLSILTRNNLNWTTKTKENLIFMLLA